MAKRKKVATKKTPTYSTDGYGHSSGILALLIIILVWWQPAAVWSQITITIAAALILLPGHSCSKKK